MNCGFSQETYHEITYRVLLANRVELEKQNDNVKQHYLKTQNELEKIRYKLIFNNNLSLFSIEKSLNNDNSGFYQKSAISIVGEDVYFRESFKSNKILIERNFLDKKFLILDRINNNWSLDRKSKKIGTYTCYLANLEVDPVFKNEKTKTVEAWYSPDLPYPIGPGEYGGLPGIIVELRTDYFILVIDEIRLNQKEITNIEQPTSGTRIGVDEFNKLVQDKLDEFGFEIKQ